MARSYFLMKPKLVIHR